MLFDPLTLDGVAGARMPIVLKRNAETAPQKPSRQKFETISKAIGSKRPPAQKRHPR